MNINTILRDIMTSVIMLQSYLQTNIYLSLVFQTHISNFKNAVISIPYHHNVIYELHTFVESRYVHIFSLTKNQGWLNVFYMAVLF